MKKLVVEWVKKAEGEEAVEEDAKSALAIMDRALALLRPEIQGLTNGQ
ncbi:MAG: hypothetical protein LWX51_06045 [Deltaproteobacteria bacterium]|jgi:hypothetical protein|nr:hypothetical protein [Deltaproteobacteria bacterium]